MNEDTRRAPRADRSLRVGQFTISRSTTTAGGCDGSRDLGAPTNAREAMKPLETASRSCWVTARIRRLAPARSRTIVIPEIAHA